MDSVVRRLQRGLAAVGAPPLLRQGAPAALHDVAAAVAPLGLPAEVDRFWRLLDGSSSSLTCFPTPTPRNRTSRSTAGGSTRSNPA